MPETKDSCAQHCESIEIMAWALGTMPVPAKYEGAQMDAFRKLDFVEIPR